MPNFDPKSIEAAVAASLRDSPPSVSAPATDPKKKGTNPWTYMAPLIGHGLDAYSTDQVMKADGLVGPHGTIHTTERNNGVYGDHPSSSKIYGTKAGMTALNMLAAHFIGKKWPKLGNAANIFGGAPAGAQGAMNLINLNKAKKAIG